MGNELRPSGKFSAVLTLFLLTTMMTAAGSAAYAEGAAAAAVSTGVTEWVDFTLPDAGGKDVSLSRFIGKMPILIAFWATWCPPCHKAVPVLNRMHTESPASNGIQILALDFMESEKKVNAFISSMMVAYPVLLDRRGRVARKYKVVGIPTYILLDREGKVVFRDHELPEFGKYLK